MASPSSPEPELHEADDIQTAEELAAYLKVDPKTVFNWAKDGVIPEALRIGRVVRFSLNDVKAALDLNRGGEGRHVELVVMALSLVAGPSFPRIPKIDLGSITMDEVAQLKTLCAAYASDLADLQTPQEQIAYCEGVIQAARLVYREG